MHILIDLLQQGQLMRRIDRNIPPRQIDLIEMPLRSGKLKAASIESLIDTSLTDVEPELDLREDLEPIIAEIALCFLLVDYATVHLILVVNYIILGNSCGIVLYNKV